MSVMVAPYPRARRRIALAESYSMTSSLRWLARRCRVPETGRLSRGRCPAAQCVRRPELGTYTDHLMA